MFARSSQLFGIAKTVRKTLNLVQPLRHFSRQSNMLDDETMQNFSAQKFKDKSHFTMNAAAKQQLQSSEQDKSSRIKNVSLTLLDIKHQAKVLDFFQANYLDQSKKGFYVEELLMVLHNLKLLLRELDE